MSDQEKLRRTVFSLAERFVPAADIVVLLEMSEGVTLTVEQLEEEFGSELERGSARGRLSLADAMAAEVKKGNSAVMIFLSKVQFGWSEKKTKPAAVKSESTEPERRRPLATILNIRDRSSRKS